MIEKSIHHSLDILTRLFFYTYQFLPTDCLFIIKMFKGGVVSLTHYSMDKKVQVREEKANFH